MKKLLLFLSFISFQILIAQSGLHYQWHGGGAIGVYGYRYNQDTMIVPLKVANVSNYNAIGIITLKNEQWSNTSYNTAFSFSAMNVTNLVMKNLNEGLCVTSGNQISLSTNDFWQTTTTQTTTINSLGATKYGYYGFTNVSGCGMCTYSVVFSSNGSAWTTVHTDATAMPIFAKSKNKLYTIHNGVLKSSSNGGSSYSAVNSTYTFNVTYPIEPVIMPLDDDTIFVKTNQLHRSFDGGITWSTTSVPTTTNSIGKIAAKNGKEVMIIDKFSPYNIYYSNNSGTSWTTYTTIPQFFSPSGDKLLTTNDFFYLSPNYKSTDGQVWQDFLKAAPAPKPYDISFTGNIGLVGVAQGYFGYTTNKGFNYTFLPNKIPSNGDVMAVKAIDINKFLVADRKSQIFVSTNQGQTWSQKTTNTINNIPRKFSVSNDKNTIVMSGVGVTHVSFDAASTFTYLNMSSGSGHYQTIKPISGKIIDVAPVYSAPSFTHTSYEFYEIDNTNTRTLISTYTVNVAQDIIDIQMADDNVGYFMTRNPNTNETIVYKTTDGFTTVAAVSTITTPTIGVRTYDGKYGSIQTFGNDTIIISGSGNPINNQTNFYHISYNGGLTWNTIYTDFSKPTNLLGNKVYKMVFFNPSEYMALISDNFCGSGQASQGVYLSTNSSGNPSTVGIRDFSLNTIDKSIIHIYPNPTSGVLKLDFENSIGKINIRILNPMGQEVLNVFLENQNESIDVRSLNAGIYFIEAVTKDKMYTSKFIKQ